MKTLQEIFDKDELLRSSSRGLSENYHFSISKNPVFSSYSIVHQEIRLIEDPLYLVRKYFLVSDVNKDTPVQITIALAWDGYERAIDFLFGFTESLDLFFNQEIVIDTRNYALGDFGVAWGWVPGEINVIAFIRNNVFVCIQGFLQKEQMIFAAKAIDAELIKTKLINAYSEEKQGFFTQCQRTPGKLTVPAGGRFDIGIQKPGVDTYFFITKSGSMNRDQVNPDLWYFRAGKEIGIQAIILLSIDEGILPKIEILQIEIVSEE